MIKTVVINSMQKFRSVEANENNTDVIRGLAVWSPECRVVGCPVVSCRSVVGSWAADVNT